MKTLITLLVLIGCMKCVCQDLEKVGGSTMRITGNISVGSSFFNAFEGNTRRSPHSYFISANPTFTFYGIDVPVNLTYRDQEGSISSPLQRLSIHPRYKWVSLHLGNTNMSLHPYVLSGQLIKGVGIELTPRNLKFSAVYGKLENPLSQLDSLIGGATFLQSFDRNALGINLGYGSPSSFIEFTVFKAKDDISSFNPQSQNLRYEPPADNLVLGTSGQLRILKWMSLKFNLASSLYTENQETMDLFNTKELSRLQENFGDFLTINFSSKLQIAGDASVDFKFKRSNFGFTYKRVDPFYKSLGTFYFLEDYENFLFKLQTSLLNQSIRFTGQFGIQRNNLNNLRSSTTTRNILNTNLTLIPNRRISTSIRYSNFQSDRSAGVVSINDSLRVSRTTELISVTPRFTFGNKNRNSVLVLSTSYQKLDDLLQGNSEARVVNNYIANVSFSQNFRIIGWRYTISALGNQNEILTKRNRRIGGSLRISKKVLAKKMKVATSVGYLQNFLNNAENGATTTVRLDISYRKSRVFTLTSSLNYLSRDGSTSDREEIRGAFKISYIFNTKKHQSI